MRLRSNDSCQRITRRISGWVKNVFSCQLPSKVKPGGAISAKIGVLSSGREPSTAPRGICFQPSAYEPPRGCNVVEHAAVPIGADHAGAERALNGRSGQIRPRSAGRERRDVQALAAGAIPIGGIGRRFERDAAAREVLREPAPGGEIQLIGALQLRQVAIQARPLRQKAEDAPLVEHVHLVLPDHVVDGRKLASVTNEQRRQTSQSISHAVTCAGSGIDKAKPARNTGCAKPSGATSGAAPRRVSPATSTEPSVTICNCFLRSPNPAGLSMRPPRAITV